MQGIADAGHGQYAFISEASEIPDKVRKTMDILSTLVASDMKLYVQGRNGAIVKQIYDYPQNDVVNGVVLGDLCQNDLRQILVQVEVSGRPDAYINAEAKSFEIMSYTVSYVSPQAETNAASDRVELKGTIRVSYTDDRALVTKQPDNVKIVKIIKDASIEDEQVLQHLNKKEKTQAIKLKAKIIDDLKAVESMDSTGTVGLLVKRYDRTLQSIQQEDDIRVHEKNMNYDKYQSKNLCRAGLL
jgi:hypothetical protein